MARAVGAKNARTQSKSPPPVKASGLRKLLMGCSSPYAVGVAIADLHGLYLGL